MAHTPVQMFTGIAAADLSAKQYYAVKIDSNGKVALAGAGESAIGILQNNPAEGQTAAVMLSGETYAVFGGTVAAGANLTPDANGKLVTASAGNNIIAITTIAAAADEIRTVVLAPHPTFATGSNTIFALPITLANITGTMDVLTEMVPGFAGTIKKAYFVVTTPVTTAAKAVTLNLEVNTTNVTGGVISLTSANCATLGAVVSGTAITAGNTFTATDKISAEAASVTAFVEGAGVLYLVLG